METIKNTWDTNNFTLFWLFITVSTAILGVFFKGQGWKQCCFVTSCIILFLDIIIMTLFNINLIVIIVSLLTLGSGVFYAFALQEVNSYKIMIIYLSLLTIDMMIFVIHIYI